MCYYYNRVIELRGYIDGEGAKPFAKWSTELDTRAAVRVTNALSRLAKVISKM